MYVYISIYIYIYIYTIFISSVYTILTIPLFLSCLRPFPRVSQRGTQGSALRIALRQGLPQGSAGFGWLSWEITSGN